MQTCSRYHAGSNPQIVIWHLFAETTVANTLPILIIHIPCNSPIVVFKAWHPNSIGFPSCFNAGWQLGVSPGDCTWSKLFKVSGKANLSKVSPDKALHGDKQLAPLIFGKHQLWASQDISIYIQYIKISQLQKVVWRDWRDLTRCEQDGLCGMAQCAKHDCHDVMVPKGLQTENMGKMGLNSGHLQLIEKWELFSFTWTIPNTNAVVERRKWQKMQYASFLANKFSGVQQVFASTINNVWKLSLAHKYCMFRIYTIAPIQYQNWELSARKHFHLNSSNWRGQNTNLALGTMDFTPTTYTYAKSILITNNYVMTNTIE